MFVEAVFKSTFGFSYVLFVTVVTLYHVDNVFGVTVNVMIISLLLLFFFLPVICNVQNESHSL